MADWRTLSFPVPEYRGAYALQRVKALGLVVAGCVAFFLLANDPSGVKPDGWLYQKFGEKGAHYATLLFGALIILAGVLWMAYAVYRIKAGSRRHEEEVRRRFLQD